MREPWYYSRKGRTIAISSRDYMLDSRDLFRKGDRDFPRQNLSLLSYLPSLMPPWTMGKRSILTLHACLSQRSPNRFQAPVVRALKHEHLLQLLKRWERVRHDLNESHSSSKLKEGAYHPRSLQLKSLKNGILPQYFPVKVKRRSSLSSSFVAM